jgi:hypothetical protein
LQGITGTGTQGTQGTSGVSTPVPFQVGLMLGGM